MTQLCVGASAYNNGRHAGARVESLGLCFPMVRQGLMPAVSSGATFRAIGAKHIDRNETA